MDEMDLFMVNGISFIVHTALLSRHFMAIPGTIAANIVCMAQSFLYMKDTDLRP